MQFTSVGVGGASELVSSSNSNSGSVDNLSAKPDLNLGALGASYSALGCRRTVWTFMD